MRREIGWRRALANALFVAAALALAAFGVVEVSRRHWLWQQTFPARAEFPTVAGLEVGARVLVQGLDAGAVEAIVPPEAPGGPVTVRLRLDERLRPLVRSDAVARIGTQGIVGAKVLEITPGRPDAPPLADGQPLRSERPRELADLMADASRTLATLDTVAVEAQAGLGEINAIAATVRRGEGTLGKLVRDDEAYRRIVALSDRGETTLQDLSDNLNALKKTWPFTRYFDQRGFDSMDRVLYQPDAERESRVFAEADLFEPGRAVLTAPGRAKLDAVATWFKSLKRPAKTEIVVAAFTDAAPGGTEEFARVLTQSQAEAVRTYLTERHKLHSNGWFSAYRKVAAVGFGTQPPPIPGGTTNGAPARRVEIILFTPQA
jgi:phospholipid/cholesterol/gamma-HCH transport system substrate-binding protein